MPRTGEETLETRIAPTGHRSAHRTLAHGVQRHRAWPGANNKDLFCLADFICPLSLSMGSSSMLAVRAGLLAQEAVSTDLGLDLDR